MDTLTITFTFTEAGDGLPVNMTHLVEELEAALGRYNLRQDGASMAGLINTITVQGEAEPHAVDYSHLTFMGRYAERQRFVDRVREAQALGFSDAEETKG